MKKVGIRTALAMVATVVALVVALNAWGIQATPTAGGKKIVLGFSSYPPDVPVIGLAQRGAKDQAKKSKVDVVFGLAPDAATQQTAVENLLARKVDVLLIDPNDSTAIGTAVKAANAQNVPVVMWIGDNLGGGKTATLISSDERQGGYTVATYLFKKLGGKGTVALIQGTKAHQAGFLREQGFRTAMKKFPGIKLAAYGEANWVEDQAYNLAQNMLTKAPNVNAILALSDAMAKGAERAVSASGGSNKPIVVGYNGDCPTLESIWKGRITATLYQGWYEVGRRIVSVGATLARGGTVPKKILVPPFIVDKAVMQQVKEGTYPGLKQDPFLKNSVAQALSGCKGLK